MSNTPLPSDLLLALLEEAFEYVGASEQQREDLWPQMLEWHVKVAHIIGRETVYV